MSSFACLRVLVPEEVNDRESLAVLVNKFACAFLETRWVWPRRHEVVGSCTFLLVEPRSADLDHHELRELAIDLQSRLFGTDGEGEVALVAFEGTVAEVARFAALQPHDLDQILNGKGFTPPFVGRLARITSRDVVAVPIPQQDVPPPVAPVRDAVIDPIFHGIYFTPREVFRGSTIGLWGSRYNLVEGQRPATTSATQELDAQLVFATVQALETMAPTAGLIFTNISYDSLVHRAVRESYSEFLGRLPEARRSQLAATVYGVPRELSYSAMPQLQAFLKRYFDYIDLQITDPAFAVEKLAPGIANSVTLVLPDADPTTRLAAIRRYSSQIEAFRARKIWLAVTNVRTQVELRACFAQGVPFVSGRAVTEALDHPVTLHRTPMGALPLKTQSQ